MTLTEILMSDIVSYGKYCWIFVTCTAFIIVDYCCAVMDGCGGIAVRGVFNERRVLNPLASFS